MNIRKLAALVCAALVMVIAAGALAVQAQQEAKLSIAINNEKITYGPTNPPGDRVYTITVKNFASSPKGFKLSGKDRGGSDFVRYSSMLKKGQTESLSLYLPSKTTLSVREVLSCAKDNRGSVNAKFGKKTVAIKIR